MLPTTSTRFVWIAPAGTRIAGEGPWRTTLVFSELGADHPGALVEALTEFSSREVNLTRIESRPRRLAGSADTCSSSISMGRGRSAVADAITALRDKAESVRIIGATRSPGNGIPGSRLGRSRAGRCPSTIVALWRQRLTLM